MEEKMEEGKGDKLQRKALSNCLDDNSVEDILTRLPVKSLVQFKCVSKRWQSMTEDPYFVQLHLSRSRKHQQLLIKTSSGIYSPKDGFEGGVAIHKLTIPSPPQSVVLGPIDGLFFFADKKNATTRIYNLGTRQATSWVPTSVPLQGWVGDQNPSYGFGFDPLTNKYKALCVWEISRIGYEYRKGKVDHVCEIFTVGENKWRKIDEVPPVKLYDGYSVYANGSIYWRNAGPSYFFPPDDELVVAFDFGTEKFRVIQIPDMIVGCPEILRKSGSRRANKFRLTAIDGHMAFVDRVDKYTAKVWISDDSYKEKKMTPNWTEETILLPSSFLGGCRLDFNPVEGTDEIVIKSHIPPAENKPRGFVTLSIYNRTTKSFREIEITGISPLLTPPFFFYGMFIAHESLIPIQDAEKKLDEATPMDTS